MEEADSWLANVSRVGSLHSGRCSVLLPLQTCFLSA